MTFSSLLIGTGPNLFQNILWSKIDSHIAPRFRPCLCSRSSVRFHPIHDDKKIALPTPTVHRL